MKCVLLQCSKNVSCNYAVVKPNCKQVCHFVSFNFLARKHYVRHTNCCVQLYHTEYSTLSGPDTTQAHLDKVLWANISMWPSTVMVLSWSDKAKHMEPHNSILTEISASTNTRHKRYRRSRFTGCSTRELRHLHNLLQRPINALVLYERNFITYRTATCSDHWCGHQRRRLRAASGATAPGPALSI